MARIWVFFVHCSSQYLNYFMIVTDKTCDSIISGKIGNLLKAVSLEMMLLCLILYVKGEGNGGHYIEEGEGDGGNWDSLEEIRREKSYKSNTHFQY